MSWIHQEMIANNKFVFFQYALDIREIWEIAKYVYNLY